jgi:hypothetical protein
MPYVNCIQPRDVKNTSRQLHIPMRVKKHLRSIAYTHVMKKPHLRSITYTHVMQKMPYVIVYTPVIQKCFKSISYTHVM